VSAANEAAGSIVVTYSGDPEPYVDCGWIVIHEDDEFERVPAAQSEASFLRRRAGEVVSVERDLTLDARMSVQVEPSGDDAIVQADSTYVLTKRIASSEGQGLCTPRQIASGRVIRTHSPRAPDASRMASWSVWYSTRCPRSRWRAAEVAATSAPGQPTFAQRRGLWVAGDGSAPYAARAAAGRWEHVIAPGV
jgi:hypothetical protein